MSELLNSLHIQWQLIAAQAVNFFLLAFILTKVAYKPLMSALNNRRETIEASLQKAADIEEQMAKFREYHEEQLVKARDEAQAIITEARTNSDTERQARLEKTGQDIEAIFTRAEKEIVAQKDDMLRDVEKRMADMLIPALENVLRESVDEDLRAKLFERSVAKVSELYKS
ncbi:MAG: F0F1 ATP synthase subunit B [Candidatus Spechtbacterales bacterium]